MNTKQKLEKIVEAIVKKKLNESNTEKFKGFKGNFDGDNYFTYDHLLPKSKFPDEASRTLLMTSAKSDLKKLQAMGLNGKIGVDDNKLPYLDIVETIIKKKLKESDEAGSSGMFEPTGNIIEDFENLWETFIEWRGNNYIGMQNANISDSDYERLAAEGQKRLDNFLKIVKVLNPGN